MYEIWNYFIIILQLVHFVGVVELQRLNSSYVNKSQHYSREGNFHFTVFIHNMRTY